MPPKKLHSSQELTFSTQSAHLGRAGRPLSSPLSKAKLPRQPENGATVNDLSCRAGRRFVAAALGGKATMDSGAYGPCNSPHDGR
jgi:hypothetical protein